MSRRHLLRSGLYTSAGLALRKGASAIGQTMASPPQVRSDVKLTRYVDPLPIPPVIRPRAHPAKSSTSKCVSSAKRCIATFRPPRFGDTTAPGLAPRLKRKTGSPSIFVGSASFPRNTSYLSITPFMERNHPFPKCATSRTFTEPVSFPTTMATLTHGSLQTGNTALISNRVHLHTRTASPLPLSGITITLWVLLASISTRAYRVSTLSATKPRERSIFPAANSKSLSCCRTASSTVMALSITPRSSTDQENIPSGSRNSMAISTV